MTRKAELYSLGLLVSNCLPIKHMIPQLLNTENYKFFMEQLPKCFMDGIRAMYLDANREYVGFREAPETDDC